MSSKRTKACDFTMAVKKAIYERDGGACILCGRPGDPVAHYISRAHNGLGIEENGLTLCWTCHQRYDNTAFRPIIRARLRQYLKSKYPAWNEKNLVYRKYSNE